MKKTFTSVLCGFCHKINHKHDDVRIDLVKCECGARGVLSEFEGVYTFPRMMQIVMHGYYMDDYKLDFDEYCVDDDKKVELEVVRKVYGGSLVGIWSRTK